jgi:hypothetical protein
LVWKRENHFSTNLCFFAIIVLIKRENPYFCSPLRNSTLAQLVSIPTLVGRAVGSGMAGERFEKKYSSLAQLVSIPTLVGRAVGSGMAGEKPEKKYSSLAQLVRASDC